MAEDENDTLAELRKQRVIDTRSYPRPRTEIPRTIAATAMLVLRTRVEGSQQHAQVDQESEGNEKIELMDQPPSVVCWMHECFSPAEPIDDADCKQPFYSEPFASSKSRIRLERCFEIKRQLQRSKP